MYHPIPCLCVSSLSGPFGLFINPPSAKTDFETMWHLMESKIEMKEGTNQLPVLDQGAHIEFNDVSFGYNNEKKSKRFIPNYIIT